MTKNIYTIINIIAIGAIIFMGVDTFYRIIGARLDQPGFEKAYVVTKPVQARRTRVDRLSDYEIINRRSIFGKTADVSQQPDDDLSEIENLEPTSLDLVLLGTVAGSQQNAYAIIADKSKRSEDIYRVGDSVKNAVIKNIYRGKVVLRVNGKDEVLSMDDAPAPASDTSSLSVNRSAVSPEQRIPTRTITLQRTEVEDSLANLQDLLTQASIRPHISNGEPDGLAITGVKADSIFRKMGLRNGDIVKGVEGNEIRSPEDLISLYNDLQNDDTVEIQIIRRGRERTINYRFR